MGRKPIKCKSKCALHSFSLKPLNYSANLTKNVNVQFCSSKQQKYAFPIFNKDKKHYTPSFILGIDQEQTKNNSKCHLLEHQLKIANIMGDDSEIMIAKPRSKNNHCSVCREPFSDYMEHIQSIKHQKQISQNKFNCFITQLCSNHMKSNSQIQCETTSSLQFISSFHEKLPSFLTASSLDSKQSFSETNRNQINNNKINTLFKFTNFYQNTQKINQNKFQMHGAVNQYYPKIRIPIIINSNMITSNK